MSDTLSGDAGGVGEDADAVTADSEGAGGDGGGNACGYFAAATLVATPQGEVPISKIKVGDMVEARNAATGKTAPEPVLKLIQRYHPVVEDLRLVNASGAAELIVASPEHPFHVAGIGWVQAEWLTADVVGV